MNSVQGFLSTLLLECFVFFWLPTNPHKFTVLTVFRTECEIPFYWSNEIKLKWLDFIQWRKLKYYANDKELFRKESTRYIFWKKLLCKQWHVCKHNSSYIKLKNKWWILISCWYWIRIIAVQRLDATQHDWTLDCNTADSTWQCPQLASLQSHCVRLIWKFIQINVSTWNM